MVDVPNNSFIPKRGPVKKARRVVSRHVYIFTFVSYILFFATLIATLGVFIFGQFVERQLDAEIVALNAEIASFSQADMERVTAFNTRLEQAKARLNATVSVATLLSIIEQSTIGTAQFANFSLERTQDTELVVTTEIETDSFDSVIFQREIMKKNPSIASVDISDMVIKDATIQELLVPDAEKIFSEESLVKFTTTLTFEPTAVAYNPTANPLSAPGVTPSPSSGTPSSPPDTSGTVQLETPNESGI